MFANSEELLAYLRDEGVKFVDVRFCDLPGVMQHFTMPVEAFDEKVFTEGLAFDGSSIRGFQQIHESDMLLLPDAATAFVDPFRAEKTVALNFFIHDPFTREPYSRDPRNVAKKAEAYLAASGIADTAYFGPEAEFYVFDSIRYDTTPNAGYYYIDSVEGAWNTGSEGDANGPNRGYKPAYKGGYFPVPPVDHFADLRDAMVHQPPQSRHNGRTCAPRGRHRRPGGDQLPVLHAAARRRHVATVQVHREEHRLGAGKTATFMPKPLFGDNGSGMHTHQSLWLRGEPLFYDETGYAGLSDTARWYIGGLLHHAPSLLAFTNPTVNSYRRLVPGFEAPVNLVYSQRNRSACTRIPVTGTNAKAKRIEFRVPDPSANPYLAFSAMLMAGLDGIRNKIEPPEPIDKDLYDLPPEEFAQVAQVPGSLPEVLDALEADHDYLLEGGVFTADLISTWIESSGPTRSTRSGCARTPHEFALYYEV